MRTALLHLAVLALGLALTPVSCLAQSSLTLAAGGRTDYVIVVGSDALAPELSAARELSAYLSTVTGAEFLVVGEGDAPTGKRWIMVGQTESVKQLLSELDWEALGHDAIVLQTRGDRLVLAGGRPRGTLYAVYTFLEDFVGCRWWTSTEEYVPRKPTLHIGRPDLTYIPPLNYRETLYLDVMQGPRFAVKLKSNGHFSPIPEELGGHYEILGWCHTFESLMPPEKYFEEHPEWYSLISGKRFAKGHSDWQLCLTNLEMRQELTKNVLETIQHSPQAGIISVSQNDGYGQCQCENCQAATDREGSGAGPLLEMINAVAEEVEQEFPGFLVETLAYHWTRKAPLHVRPRRNVLIRLTGLECDFAQPVDSEGNADYRGDIESWSSIAKSLFVWHYVADFACYVQPHPNLLNIGPDVRFFVRNNAVGVFVEGDHYNPIGDFCRLRAWVVAQMLWDPSRDPMELATEFAHGYYGPAGPPISAYLQLAHDAVQRSGMRLSYGNDDTSFFSLEEMNEATRLWDQAEAAVAGDPALLTRVRRDRLPLDVVWLRNWARLKREAERESREFMGPTDLTAACDEYLKRATEFTKSHFTTECRNSEDFVRRWGIEPGETCRRQLELYAAPPPVPPTEAPGLDEGDYHVFGSGELNLINTVERVPDPLATDGNALRLSGNWGTAQFRVQSYFAGRWHVYARVRCEMKETPENGHDTEERGGGYLSPQEAFELGIFDHFLYPFGRYVPRKDVVPLKNVRDGGYHTYDLGVHDLKPGNYVWVTIADAQGVSAVYVDRVFLVRE